MEIDWSKAPKGSEFYAHKKFRRESLTQSLPVVYNMSKGWIKGIYTLRECQNAEDYQRKPKEWPTDERISAIAQNGGDGLHYDDIKEKLDSIGVYNKPAATQQNKYDRTIIGKYGNGKCVVDVYRVLNAFPTGSPEIDHSVKKLLAAGKRGAKDELQDLREAIQSIEARIDYLMESKP